jgi:RHS repeat-associated protein
MPHYSHNRFGRPVILLVRRLLPVGCTGRQACLYCDNQGNVIGVDPPADSEHYRFTAREVAGESALLYPRARFYDPTPGRWLSEDALGFFAGDDHLHPYPSPAALDAYP